MIILGIETSCDETACALLQKNGDTITILSNIVASSAEIQAKYGGVIPEQAAREQLKSIIPVIKEALTQSNIHPPAIDAIAVTHGPGLIGSLLVGVETAKVLAKIWNKPLIPVNHLLGHFYANWIQDQTSDSVPKFPCIGLLVSGGHTDLVLFKDHGQYDYLGGTRDDAAGECFDKCARLLNLPYPGGPKLAKLAQGGDPTRFSLPTPMINSKDLDFSFSGLKTAVANLIPANHQKADLAASVEKAIVDVLIKKTITAIQRCKAEQVMIAGGVASNKYFSAILRSVFHGQSFIPLPHLCTDNAAMIAACAFYNFHPIDPVKVQVNPALSLESIKP